MEIKANAIFIADSHYNFQRKTLYTLLNDIDKENIRCSQLFLMGDMFDFLSAKVKYFTQINEKVIELIQNLSSKIEIFYFEGNHDFYIKELFPKAIVVPRQNQAYSMSLGSKSVQLAHGDIFVGDAYDKFCKVLRNKYFLSFFNALDISSFLSKKIESALAAKHICNRITDFKYIVQKRIDKYKADIVIEGHYHVGKSYSFGKRKYINVPSLACSNEYIRYNGKEFLWEKYEKL